MQIPHGDAKINKRYLKAVSIIKSTIIIKVQTMGASITPAKTGAIEEYDLWFILIKSFYLHLHPIHWVRALLKNKLAIEQVGS